MKYRFNIYIFDWDETAHVHQPARASEGNEPMHYIGFRKAFLCDQKASTNAWQWNFEVQWSFMGTAKENCCT